ncbi:flavin reductase family protein [Rhodococcus erythropolis]|uniref:flavin reductase family protein n=1 Tax=Rhodococcus erythropolis TaxID=1833 RepID=UPI0030843031
MHSSAEKENMYLVPLASDPATLRRVFGHYPSGVAAIAATIQGEDFVLISSSFTVGVSFEPPLVLFSVQKSSQSWPSLRQAQHLGVSVLGNEQGSLCRQLSGERETRFSNVPLKRTETDALFFSGASIWLDCSVYATHEAGDHDVIVLQVHSVMSDHDLDPLVYHGSRFRPLN